MQRYFRILANAAKSGFECRWSCYFNRKFLTSNSNSLLLIKNSFDWNMHGTFLYFYIFANCGPLLSGFLLKSFLFFPLFRLIISHRKFVVETKNARHERAQRNVKSELKIGALNDLLRTFKIAEICISVWTLERILTQRQLNGPH